MAAMFRRGFTKPLIFTLLCLVYFTNALLDADKVEEMKMKAEELQQQNDRLKEYFVSEYSGVSEFIDESIDLVEHLTEYVKLFDFPAGFPSLHGYMEQLRRYMWNTKNFTEGRMKELGGKIQENDERLRKLRKIINFIEERRAEL